MTDPIGDFLTRIRNGYLAGKKTIEVPHAKIKEKIGEILVKEGYLKGMEVEGKKPQEKKLVLSLKYPKKKPAIIGIKRVSKPGVRLYAKTDKIPRVRWGKGLVILSTPGGLMTDKEAKKKKLGGEVICQVW